MPFQMAQTICAYELADPQLWNRAQFKLGIGAGIDNNDYILVVKSVSARRQLPSELLSKNNDQEWR